MKKCPKCNDFVLYDDTVQSCPVCDTALVAYVRNYTAGSTRPASAAPASAPVRPAAQSTNTAPVRPTARPASAAPASTPARPAVQSANTAPVRPTARPAGTAANSRPRVPQFETRSGGRRYQYRGTVTEIHPNSRLNSGFKKWMNALFRGEPYQFSHTSHETVFRVEGFHPGAVSGPRRDLIFYGDVEGRFNYGDDVTVLAKRKGDRYVVTRMYLNETNSRVRPGPQLPAWLIVSLTVFLLIFAIDLLSGFAGFVASGGLVKLLLVVGAVILVWRLIRRSVRRRR